VPFLNSIEPIFLKATPHQSYPLTAIEKRGGIGTGQGLFHHSFIF